MTTKYPINLSVLIDYAADVLEGVPRYEYTATFVNHDEDEFNSIVWISSPPVHLNSWLDVLAYSDDAHEHFCREAIYEYPDHFIALKQQILSALSDVNDLKTSPPAHTHVIDNIDGLQTALNEKAPSDHTHSNATTATHGFMSASDKQKLDSLPTVPTYSNPTRSFNSNFKPSETKNANVSYSVTINTQSSLSGGQTGEVYLEISENGSSGWITVAKVANQNTGTLVLGLTLQQNITFCLSGYVPADWTARLRTNNVTGSPSYSYQCGQEVLL